MDTPPSPIGPPELAPREVVDRYRVEKRLGQGGMATVYRVRHLQLGSVHALKLLMGPSDALAKRLLLEGRVQARLVHPNVVQVTDVVTVRGSPALVLEFVAGPTLGEVVDALHPLDVEQLDRLAGQLLRGVEVAHGLGFAHRDLKPANVLVADGPDGPVAKVADFGLAKVLEGLGLDSTRPNVAMGTPSYMAPEQILDARSADQRSDVFSLGAILYELCAGRRAFDGATMFVVFRKIGAGEYVPLRVVRPDLPERMLRAVERALCVDREGRPASARELRAEWDEQPGRPDAFGARLAALFHEHRRDADPFTPSPEAETPAPVDRGATMVPDSLSAVEVGSSASRPPPAGARRGWAWAGAAGAVGLLALGGLAAAAVAFRPAVAPPAAEPPPARSSPPAPEATPQPARGTAPDAPEGSSGAAAPVPAPAAPPRPAPARPAPAATAPAPAPTPAPATAAEASPAPSAAGTGEVVVVGDAARVWFTPKAGGARQPPGALAPGRWRIDAVWDDEPRSAGEVVVEAGRTVTVTCRRSVRVCR